MGNIIFHRRAESGVRTIDGVGAAWMLTVALLLLLDAPAGQGSGADRRQVGGA